MLGPSVAQGWSDSLLSLNDMMRLFSGVLFAGLTALFSFAVAYFVIWHRRADQNRFPRFRSE
jgi:hypothetical protein